MLTCLRWGEGALNCIILAVFQRLVRGPLTVAPPRSVSTTVRPVILSSATNLAWATEVLCYLQGDGLKAPVPRWRG